MPSVFLKSAKLKPARTDGARVLVERSWPPGLPRGSARVHLWLPALGPSRPLRQWFRKRPAQWPLFRKRYLEELFGPEGAGELEQLYELAASRPRLTLLHAFPDEQHSAAMVLKQLLEGMRKPPSSSGPARRIASAAAARGRPRR